MLPAIPPRRHLRADLDLTALADLSAAYAELLARPLPDVAALTAWLRAWSELEAHLDEDRTRRGIARACATDDPAALAADLDFTARIAPHCEPRSHQLARRLLAHPCAGALEPGEHARLLRRLADEVELHHDRMPALDADEQRLLAAWQADRAALTAAWDGEPRALAAIEAALDAPERPRRASAWHAVAAAWSAARPALDIDFDRLLAVRRAQADVAGFVDVRAHRFRRLARDYTPDDSLALDAAIADHFVPLAADLQGRRRRALDLPALRPWDLAAPLAPADLACDFTDEASLIAACTATLARLDPDLAAQFTMLARRGLLDLVARPNKAPGAWQAQLAVTGLPFVAASAVGRREDLWTVLHEAGHALHALACAGEPLLWNRNAPREFAELAATAVELIAGANLDLVLGEPAARAARRAQLEQVALFLPFMACVDRFEHWLYTDREGAACPAARDDAWLALHRRHCPGVDWHDLEADRAALWQRPSHIFAAPFYFAEYGLAQLGALRLLARWQHDPRGAVAALRRALALGGRAGLADLHAAADLRLDFSPAAVADAATFLAAELDRLA